ncbi:MAG: tetratricopeptide repeat protein [Proteobacteria bacterium]|nr:tetratricopeptide repeat protein [Pseudomonadota bacterium]
MGVLLLAFLLGGCGIFSGLRDMVGGAFRSTAPNTNLAIAALARGNFAEAEVLFDQAIEQNPHDPYALLGKGILYQSTDRPEKARQIYERLVVANPDAAATIGDWHDLVPRSIAEIAHANLAQLDGVSAELTSAKGAAGSMAVPADMGSAQAAMPPPPPRPETGAENAGARFRVLKRLMDEGLVTPEEFEGRRQANLGALLPLTGQPPAAGLDRPVPAVEQIASRLRALSRSLEMRAISPRAHAAERAVILDAILPREPLARAPRAAAPKGLLAVASRIGEMERLREEGLIGAAELERERAAIEAGFQASAPASAPQQAPMALARPSAPAPAAVQAPARPVGLGVHLASYRSRAGAEKGWADILAAQKDLLGAFGPVINRVDLGPGKGVFFRLKVGPLASPAAAQDLCVKLRARKLFCQPSPLDAG